MIWIALLPAAAECVASVWFPEMSFRGLDLQLAMLNITGALFEGFFDAFDRGAAEAAGPIGDMMSYLTDDMRGSFLSTYTSWAGMVGFAAALAHSHESLVSGFAYLLCCVLLGFIAHAIGQAVAAILFPADKTKSKSARPRSVSFENFEKSYLRLAVIGAVISFIFATYRIVKVEIKDYDDADLATDVSGLAAFFPPFDQEHKQLVIGMLCSVAGAYTGNALGGTVDNLDLPVIRSLKDMNIAVGTLVCNTLFATLGLVLNAATLRYAPWKRSVLLQSFAGSFCGAASAFAGHATDVRFLYLDRGVLPAVRNMLVNIACAWLVFLIALQVERMLSVVEHVDRNADGVVQIDEVMLYYGLGGMLEAESFSAKMKEILVQIIGI